MKPKNLYPIIVSAFIILLAGSITYAIGTGIQDIISDKTPLPKEVINIPITTKEQAILTEKGIKNITTMIEVPTQVCETYKTRNKVTIFNGKVVSIKEKLPECLKYRDLTNIEKNTMIARAVEREKEKALQPKVNKTGVERTIVFNNEK